MVNTSVAVGCPGVSVKVTLEDSTAESAAGWTTGGDRARRRVRSWQWSSTAARSPSVVKADHVCMKWNMLGASPTAWWEVIPNTTPPHFKEVTCNAKVPHIFSTYSCSKLVLQRIKETN